MILQEVLNVLWMLRIKKGNDTKEREREIKINGQVSSEESKSEMKSTERVKENV